MKIFIRILGIFIVLYTAMKVYNSPTKYYDNGALNTLLYLLLLIGGLSLFILSFKKIKKKKVRKS